MYMIKRNEPFWLGVLLLALAVVACWNYFTYLKHKPIIRSVSAGQSYSIVLLADGNVWGWGGNDDDQLGIEERSSIRPVQMPGLRDICAIEAGLNHLVALDASGTVWWRGSYNDAYDHSDEPNYQPSLEPITHMVMISAGGHHDLALDERGIVWAWGYNNYGQLGNGTISSARKPVQVEGLDDVISIAAGTDHSLAIRSDGTLWGWGDNRAKQISSGLPNKVLRATKIDGPGDIVQVSGGYWHSIALAKDGRVWVWGVVDWTSIPEIMDGAIIDQYYDLTPLEFPSPAIAIDAGGDYSTVLLKNGQVWTWGVNSHGQLGNNTLFTNIEPNPVMGLSGIKLIAAGNHHNIVVDEHGTLWGWGLDEEMQVGTSSSIEFYLNTAFGNHPELEYEILEPRSILNHIEMTGSVITCP